MWHQSKEKLIADSKSVLDQYGIRMLIVNTTLTFGKPDISWVLIRLENMELHSLLNMFHHDIMQANPRHVIPTRVPTIRRQGYRQVRVIDKRQHSPTLSPVPLHDDDAYKDADDDKV